MSATQSTVIQCKNPKTVPPLNMITNRYLLYQICNLITITERLIIINGLFLIDFKWSVLGPLILITIAD
jgi:hypothetical protein